MPEPDKDKKRKKCMIVFVAVSDAIFGVIGCLLVALGVLMMTNYIWDNRAHDTLMFIPNLTLLANITGSNGWTDEEIANISLDMSTIAREPAVIMLCLGSAFILLTLLGFLNCCDDDTTLALVVNVVIISVLVLAETVLCALFWAGQFTPTIKSKLNDTLTDEYFGAEGKYDVSVAWNFIMLEMECCGLEGYEDYQHASTWVKNYTKLEDGTPTIVSLPTPMACCKFEGDFPDEADYVDADKCLTSSTLHKDNSNFDQGCWEAVNNYLEDKNYTTIGFATTVALLGLQGVLWIGILITSGMRLYSEYKKKQANKVGDVSGKQKPPPVDSRSLRETKDKKKYNSNLIHVQPEERLNSFIFG